MTPPSDDSPSFFARTNFRNKGISVGIKQADRLSHMYVIGKTGTGKSTLLETLALQDI
jgi:type IV secretory pathway VirB4 component